MLVYYQPTARVPAGSPFSLVIHALTSTNALASSYSGTVTLTLATYPPALPGRHHDRHRERRHRLLRWTDFEPARQLRYSGHRQRSEQRQHGHHRAGSTPRPPQIQSATVLFTQKTNKTHKPIGKPVLTGYQFTFNMAMNSSTTDNSANYLVQTYVPVKVKVGETSEASSATRRSASR